MTLPDGAYTVKYNAQDLAGNISQTRTFAFTIDATTPKATIKDGAAYTVATGAGYDLISFKLYDAGKIDKVTLNGKVKDLTNNTWSDINFIKPGTFGGVRARTPSSSTTSRATRRRTRSRSSSRHAPDRPHPSGAAYPRRCPRSTGASRAGEETLGCPGTRSRGCGAPRPS